MVALSFLILPTAASADGGKQFSVADPLLQSECGSCHVVYPAALLPATAWNGLIDTLTRHFGVDASLDPPVAEKLRAWLTAHAGQGKRVAGAETLTRVSDTAWFQREHRGLGFPPTGAATAIADRPDTGIENTGFGKTGNAIPGPGKPNAWAGSAIPGGKGGAARAAARCETCHAAAAVGDYGKRTLVVKR